MKAVKALKLPACRFSRVIKRNYFIVTAMFKAKQKLSVCIMLNWLKYFSVSLVIVFISCGRRIIWYHWGASGVEAAKHENQLEISISRASHGTQHFWLYLNIPRHKFPELGRVEVKGSPSVWIGKIHAFLCTTSSSRECRLPSHIYSWDSRCRLAWPPWAHEPSRP